MSEKKIRVRFLNDGTMEAETEGVKGSACVETMTQVMGELGVLQSDRTTEDFYDDPDTQVEAEKQSG